MVNHDITKFLEWCEAHGCKLMSPDPELQGEIYEGMFTPDGGYIQNRNAIVRKYLEEVLHCDKTEE